MKILGTIESRLCIHNAGQIWVWQDDPGAHLCSDRIDGFADPLADPDDHVI